MNTYRQSHCLGICTGCMGRLGGPKAADMITLTSIVRGRERDDEPSIRTRRRWLIHVAMIFSKTAAGTIRDQLRCIDLVNRKVGRGDGDRCAWASLAEHASSLMTEAFDGDALPRDTSPNSTVEKFEIGHGVPTGALMSAGIPLFVEGKLWRVIRGG